MNSWQQIASDFSDMHLGCSATLHVDNEPTEADGYRKAIGLPVGQVADWRYSYDDGSCLHVQSFGNQIYSVHRDFADPAKSKIAHLVIDAPGVAVPLGMVSGAAMGAAIGGPVGAIIGGLFGSISTAIAGRLARG